MTFFVRLIQLVIIVIPIILFGWLATQWFVPSGVFFSSHIVGQASPFITELQPSSRVGEVRMSDGGNWEQPIVDDPAFFFMHPHREFASVDVEVWFKNDTLGVVELGGLSSVEPERYTLKPLHNKIIEDSTWSRIDQDGMVLLQRNNRYESLESFYSNPPARNDVAVYRTDYDVPYRLDSYTASSVTKTMDVSLRGHHELKTYIKDEALLFDFQYMDMNRDEGEDSISVLVFNEEGLPVAEARASDDGNISMDARPSGLEKLSLRVDGLPEGVYKLVINAPRDIFFRKVHTPQSKAVFLNTVFIGDEVAYREPPDGTRFWTNTERMVMQTRHAEGVQDVSVDGETLSIAEPYQWYESVPGDGLSEVRVPAGDLEIVMEGKIAFIKSQYFNPDPINITAYTDLETLDVDYVLGEYVSPRKEGDWLVSIVSFGADELYAEDDGTWKISFSTPLVAQFDTEVLVHKINTWFYRNLPKL
ncbi:hypothetical protein HOI18_00015 [Candidatus Uhrbacteria bacterium]|jgi:hypothetical protein|nr:hypothetical protein [Candidatus Uhrbacteria bacterium]